MIDKGHRPAAPTGFAGVSGRGRRIDLNSAVTLVALTADLEVALDVTAANIAERIAIEPAQLEAFCRRHDVRRLSLFGSALRADFRAESDIDLLVEFKPGVRVSLFDLGGMNMELAEILGRPVDLRTSEDLSQYFRDEVLRTARPLYAA